MSKSALVLGATGFIGGHVARAAINEGWQVRALRRRPGAVGNLTEDGVTWLEGDIDHPETLKEALAEVDVLFHVAGCYPVGNTSVAAHMAHSVQQTRGLIRAAFQAGVSKFIYTSSLSTIGLPPGGSGRLADERDAYLPGELAGSAYYECKYAMESEMLRAAADGLPVVILNPTLVLGPGDVHLTVGGLVTLIARGRGWAWPPGDTNVIDVRDTAQAHLAAVSAGEIGQRYILGGTNISIRELMSLIAESAGKAGPRFGISQGLLRALARVLNIPGLRLYAGHLRALKHWQAYDTSKAQRALGLQTRPIETTIVETVDWYRLHGHL